MHNKGLTFIELIIGLAIISILTTIGIPSFIDWLYKTRVDNEISHLNRLLLLARNYAINTGKTVTVCPLDQQKNCNGNWQQAITAFLDVNQNKKFEPNHGDVMLQQKSAIHSKDKLLYARLRMGVTYQANGRLKGWGSNGTFRYCPFEHHHFAKGIRVAVSGRTYITADIDNDGKDEDRNRRELNCL
jgi:prepilin-type N-terminal cleavage/methylation domain-containing protein